MGELLIGMPATGCAVDRAEAASSPGFYPCLHGLCDNPNSEIMSSGIVYRRPDGSLVRPDIWPTYCVLGKLAGLPTESYRKLAGLAEDGVSEY